jgi:hypothetical protein
VVAAAGAVPVAELGPAAAADAGQAVLVVVAALVSAEKAGIGLKWSHDGKEQHFVGGSGRHHWTRQGWLLEQGPALMVQKKLESVVDCQSSRRLGGQQKDLPLAVV